MSESITVTHEHGERIAVSCGGVELMSYVYRPDPVAFESRKPYVHPLRTLAGNVVTGYRPHDHRWHKGLQMTASHLSGQNFWGGNTYVPGTGYQALPERVGAMRHDAFESVDVADDRLDLVERLTWIAHDGAEWAGERRTVSAHSVDLAAGTWALDWSIELTNLCASPLHFGSPTTAGREMAGYTGLHWRGPREFTGGHVFGPGERGQDELMGRETGAAPWLAFVSEHDAVDSHSTLVFAHAPENERAIHESHWFVRSEPTPVVAFSWAFFEEFHLDPGARFSYRYRTLVADGSWDRPQVEKALDAHPW